MACEQCILQWTYTAGNNWGTCANGTGSLGCGPQVSDSQVILWLNKLWMSGYATVCYHPPSFQETFRACSDIRILPGSAIPGGNRDANTFSEDTTFDVDQFEDYYDELFGSNNNEIAINEIEEEELGLDEVLTNEIITSITSVQSQKLRLLKKKLILAKALKGLRNLIRLSNLKDDAYDEPEDLFADGNDITDEFSEYGEARASTIRPWWARTNSHGRRRRKRRRKKRFSFWYDVMF